MADNKTDKTRRLDRETRSRLRPGGGEEKKERRGRREIASMTGVIFHLGEDLAGREKNTEKGRGGGGGGGTGGGGERGGRLGFLPSRVSTTGDGLRRGGGGEGGGGEGGRGKGQEETQRFFSLLLFPKLEMELSVWQLFFSLFPRD